MFNSTFTMTGTTGTTFTGIAKLAGGNVGYREIGNGQYRVRVAPLNGPIPELSSSRGWSQPGYGVRENRHSIVVNGLPALFEAVAFAIKASTNKSAAVIAEAKNALIAAESAAFAAKQKYLSLAQAA